MTPTECGLKCGPGGAALVCVHTGSSVTCAPAQWAHYVPAARQWQCRASPIVTVDPTVPVTCPPGAERCPLSGAPPSTRLGRSTALAPLTPSGTAGQTGRPRPRSESESESALNALHWQTASLTPPQAASASATVPQCHSASARRTSSEQPSRAKSMRLLDPPPLPVCTVQDTDTLNS